MNNLRTLSTDIISLEGSQKKFLLNKFRLFYLNFTVGYFKYSDL